MGVGRWVRVIRGGKEWLCFSMLGQSPGILIACLAIPQKSGEQFAILAGCLLGYYLLT